MSTQTTALATLFDTHASGPSHPRHPAAPHLVDALIRTGRLTETGLSRRARPRPCPRCGTWTIAGLDADRCALEAHCDPTPLTALGEVIALASGRRTLELVRTRGRLELEQRWADHIADQPAGTTRGDVLATHLCHQPIPSAWTRPSTHIPPVRPAADQPDF